MWKFGVGANLCGALWAYCGRRVETPRALLLCSVGSLDGGELGAGLTSDMREYERYPSLWHPPPLKG
jgi:hypothetical protein